MVRKFKWRPASRTPRLNVIVQFGTSRRRIPHARNLRAWAVAAFAAPPWPQTTNPKLQVPRELTIRVVGAAESRRLNRAWRGKDKPTNVLSFPAGESMSPTDAAPLGDLAICVPVVLREAKEQGKLSQAHWAHMVVHGVLHLLGYDHENNREAREMEGREIEILSQFKYPNPYCSLNSE